MDTRIQSWKAVCAVGLLIACAQTTLPAAAQPAAPHKPSEFRVKGVLPPPPAHAAQQHRKLRLLRQAAKFQFADDFGRTFAVGRDSFGNMIPAFTDPTTGTLLPVFFDPTRDVFF